MKKLLTIVALALVLCLGVSAAIAYDWNDLDDNQKANIQEQVENWMDEGEIFDSANLEFPDPDHFVYTESDGDEYHGGFGWCEEHAEEKMETRYYYKSGNSTVEIFDDPYAAACQYDVYSQRQCTVCGYETALVLTYAKVNHEYTTVGWTTSNPSKLAKWADPTIVLAKDATPEELASFVCSPDVAKGTKIYLAAMCDRCGTWKSLDSKTANGAHKWKSDEAGNYADTIEDVLKWAWVVDYPTCQDKGWAVDYCTVCGSWGEGWAIPTVGHSYTEKVYDYDNLPSCKNGLTATYAIQCEWCDTFEGGIINWDKAKKYTAVLTADEAISLGLVDYEWAKFNDRGWEGWLNADDWYAQNHDAEGHFYVVLSDESWTWYPCVANETVKLSCVFCGKVKTVSTSGKEDQPMYTNVLKEEYINCYELKVTYQCAGCQGKVHPNKVETIILTDDDERAHAPYWTIDTDKFVAPTCTKDGSVTFFCALHPTVTVTEKLYATGHAWGAYAVKEKGANRTVYEATCLVCGEKNYVTIWNYQDPEDHWLGTSTYWKQTAKTAGTCIAPATVTYSEFWSDTNTATGASVTYYGEFGDHIMEVVTDAAKAPTCTEEGIQLKICVTCTNYKPLTEAEKKALKHDYSIVDDLQGGKIFEAVIIPATGHKVDTWTENEDGELEGICTVCKQTVTKEKEVGDATVTLTDLKYTGNILSGKLVFGEGKKPEKLSIRVTFFIAGNNYVTTTATIYEDGTFEAEGAGDIEAITLVVYAADKVVNPADVAGLTKLDAKEIVVK